MKLKSSIITTKTNNSLNTGSKPSFPTMLSVKRSDKLMSPLSNIWPKSKPSRNLKITLKLSSHSVKTNGSRTPLLPKSSNSKVIKSKEALVMISTGKKERISPSRPLKRKERTKRKPFKKKLNLSSTFSRKLIWPNPTKKIRRVKLKNKTKMKKMTKSQSSKGNTKSQMSFMRTWSQDHWNTSWVSLVLISETLRESKVLRELKKMKMLKTNNKLQRRREKESERILLSTIEREIYCLNSLFNRIYFIKSTYLFLIKWKILLFFILSWNFV